MPRKPWWEGREPKFSTVTPAGYAVDYVEWERGDRSWRKYLIQGEPCMSVTEILGLIDDGKASGMAYAAGRIWLAGMCRVLAVEKPDAFTTDPEWWEKELKSRKLIHTDVWGAKASTGTDIHTILEELCEGKVPSIRDVPEDQQGYARALCEFWADHDPQVLHSEVLLGSLAHKYCGRCDLIYTRGGKTIALDAKTSKSVRASYALQLAAYAGAYEEAGYGAVDEMEVLWLKPDGYELIRVTASPQQFYAVLDAYRAHEQAKSDLKAAA